MIFTIFDPARLVGAATPIRILGPASPSLVFVRTTAQAKPLARRDRNLQLLKYKVEHLVINFLITNKQYHKQGSYKIDFQMKAQACERTKFLKMKLFRKELGNFYEDI